MWENNRELAIVEMEQDFSTEFQTDTTPLKISED